MAETSSAWVTWMAAASVLSSLLAVRSCTSRSNCSAGALCATIICTNITSVALYCPVSTAGLTGAGWVVVLWPPSHAHASASSATATTIGPRNIAYLLGGQGGSAPNAPGRGPVL